MIVMESSGSARGSEDGNFNINEINGFTSTVSLAVKRRKFMKESEILICSNSSEKFIEGKIKY